MQDAVTWGIIWAVVLITLFWYGSAILMLVLSCIADGVSRWKKDEWMVVGFITLPLLVWLVAGQQTAAILIVAIVVVPIAGGLWLKMTQQQKTVQTPKADKPTHSWSIWPEGSQWRKPGDPWK